MGSLVEEETGAQTGCVRGPGASRRGAMEAGHRCLLSPRQRPLLLLPSGAAAWPSSLSPILPQLRKLKRLFKVSGNSSV